MRFALLLLLSVSAWAQTPAAALRQFYADYQGLKISGLPNRVAAGKLGQYWSTALQAAISTAQAEQYRCIKKNPHEKGPWVEGDMFASNFEGFTKFRVDDAAASPVTVNFEYTENGKTFSWADQVHLIKEGTQWLIDDVVYRRQQGFGNGFGASLRNSLKGKGCK